MKTIDKEAISMIKHLNVAAAIIVKDGKILATQRKTGEFKDGWEFPGGKLEPGETPEQACRREIMEELELAIDDVVLFDHIEYEYDGFHLSMDCFTCHMASSTITLHDHEDMRWLGASDIMSVGWLPADLELVKRIADARIVD